MSDTPQLVYLRGGHISGHTVPLAPQVMEQWKRGQLQRVNEDGSDWQGDQFALPGEPGSRIDTSTPGDEDQGDEPTRPRGNASRIEWAGYAVALGACSEEEAEKLTRDELQALCTPPEEKPGQ